MIYLGLILITIFNFLSFYSSQIISISTYDDIEKSLYLSKYIKNNGAIKFSKLNDTQIKNSFYSKGGPFENYSLLNDNSGSTIVSNFKMYRNKKLLALGKDYNINFSNISISDNQEKLNKSSHQGKMKNFLVECTDNLSQIKFNFNESDSILETIIIEKIENFQQFSIILYRDYVNSNLIFRIVANKTLERLDFNNVILDKRDVLNFWTFKPFNNFVDSNSSYNFFPFLAVSNSENISMFCLDKNIIQLCNKLNYKKLIPGAQSLQDLNITKIGIMNEFLFFSTYENGLNIFRYNFSTKSYDFLKSISNFIGTDNNLYSLRILDFVINESTVYIIVEKYGMKIFSLLDMNLTRYEFLHPHMISFDAFILDKQITNLKYYRGIFIKSRVNKEFFIEINVINENRPLINKIYSSKILLNVTGTLYDGNFTYLFDNNSKNLFMIKRSLNSLSPTITHNIKLIDNKLNLFGLSLIGSFYNSKSKLNLINLKSKSVNRKVYSIENIILSSRTLKCIFNKVGSYFIEFYINKPVGSIQVLNQILDNYNKDLNLNNFVNHVFINLDINDSNSYMYIILSLVLGIFLVFISLTLYLVCKKKDILSIYPDEDVNENQNKDNKVNVVSLKEIKKEENMEGKKYTNV